MRIAAEPAVRVEPTTLSVLHWGRLLDGELFATSRYVQWAVLMKRTFRFDALRCPRCERKMRVLPTITDPKAVRRILDHLNPSSHPTAAAPARDPTWEPMAFGFDAGVAGHTARARHGQRTPRSSSQRCARSTARRLCDDPLASRWAGCSNQLQLWY
ncbi:hypothetical protein ACMHYB_21600 [Sorangium sp. So ce1128]